MSKTLKENEIRISPTQGLFFIAVLLLFILGYFYGLIQEISMLSRIEEGAALVKVRPSTPALLVMVPALMVLIAGIALRLLNKMTAKRQKVGLVIIVASFPLFLMTWFIFSLQLSDRLETHGYSECGWYSGASFGAPQVMVLNEQFCIKEGYQVRIDLLDWFEQQYRTGTEISVEMVSKKQQQLLDDFQRKFN